MQAFAHAACVHREEHVCLIQSLKSNETTGPHFPNISFFFFFFLAIAYVTRKMKDACVQAAAEKPPRSRGDYPRTVQVISLSKETEIRIDGTLEYYSSRTQSPDLPGMVQMYEKNHLYPHSSSIEWKKAISREQSWQCLVLHQFIDPYLGGLEPLAFIWSIFKLDLETLNWRMCWKGLSLKIHFVPFSKQVARRQSHAHASKSHAWFQNHRLIKGNAQVYPFSNTEKSNIQWHHILHGTNVVQLWWISVRE